MEEISGSMGGEEVTVYDVRFYRAGAIERGSYCYDEADETKSLPLRDIPPRYFSEAVWQLAKAAASGRERDEDWKSGRRQLTRERISPWELGESS